jgi:predicted aspartyl protease
VKALSLRAERLPECIYQLRSLAENQYHFETHIWLEQGGKKIKAKALINSGASGSCIHPRMIQKNKLRTTPLHKPIEIYNADGTLNAQRVITRSAPVILNTGTHRTEQDLAVAGIGNDDIILGLDWLQVTNPRIDWKKGTLSHRQLG